MRATNGHFKWSNQHLNVANVLQPSPPENGKWSIVWPRELQGTRPHRKHMQLAGCN